MTVDLALRRTRGQARWSVGELSPVRATRRLAFSIKTPIGTYAAGTEVQVVAYNRYRITVCLDLAHPTGVCHRVELDAGWLRAAS